MPLPLPLLLMPLPLPCVLWRTVAVAPQMPRGAPRMHGRPPVPAAARLKCGRCCAPQLLDVVARLAMAFFASALCGFEKCGQQGRRILSVCQLLPIGLGVQVVELCNGCLLVWFGWCSRRRRDRCGVVIWCGMALRVTPLKKIHPSFFNSQHHLHTFITCHFLQQKTHRRLTPHTAHNRKQKQQRNQFFV
jgi:hypothetical protein